MRNLTVVIWTLILTKMPWRRLKNRLARSEWTTSMTRRRQPATTTTMTSWLRCGLRSIQNICVHSGRSEASVFAQTR